MQLASSIIDNKTINAITAKEFLKFLKLLQKINISAYGAVLINSMQT